MTLKQEQRIIKDIQTNLSLIGKYCINFDLESKEIVLEFYSALSSLQNNFKTEKNISSYLKKNQTTSNYYKIPFLWFSVDFFQLILRFYWNRVSPTVFILKNIRKVVKLLKEYPPNLETEVWEQLQHECNEEIITLLESFHLNCQSFL